MRRAVSRKVVGTDQRGGSSTGYRGGDIELAHPAQSQFEEE